MARAGIDVEWLDERSIIRRSLPEANLRRHPPRTALELLLDGLRRPLPEVIDALAASIACHSAVRAGDPLMAEGMQELLRRPVAAENRSVTHRRLFQGQVAIFV
jgi:DNA mismatch repair ATPase MutL